MSIRNDIRETQQKRKRSESGSNADVNNPGASGKRRNEPGAGKYEEKDTFIYVTDRIERCRNRQKIGAPEGKMTRKNQKFAGFRPYKRRSEPAYSSSSQQLKTCSPGAAAPAERNQSGDYRSGNQGLVVGPVPGLELGKQQARLDLLKLIERTFQKD